jgi:hypothetical protein
MIRELPNVPVLYDDVTQNIVGLKHPNGVEMPIGTGSMQTLTYAATVTPDVSKLTNVALTLTGNVSIANPVNVPAMGAEVTFHFTQDSTGGRTVTWGTNYVFPSAWSNTGNTAGLGSSITFTSNGKKLFAKGGNAWA